jgi:hypothetical protein
MPTLITVGTHILRRIVPLVTLLAWTGAVTAADLRPAGAEGFFVTPHEPTVLRWSVESGEVATPLAYTIRDYWGQPVASDQAKPSTAQTVEATVKLPQGFYELELTASKQRFGLVSLPAHPPKRDPFFAIDSALSWLVQDGKVREGLIKALRRSGVAMSRERLAWSQINPAQGKWNWDTPARYDAVRRFYADQSVEVLEMFHDAPGWPGRVGKYPEDLVATARAWRQVVARWHSTWGGLEVWNEPDIFFGANLPADQYVPLVKMMAYVLDQERTKLPLVGGVFAHCNRTFLETAADNGMLDCVDAVSFHTYGQAPQMEALIGDYRAWLRAHQREAMPLWITECGRPWKRGPDRPPTDQDALSALDVTMKAVEARAGGIARYFAFVYPFFEENENNFGLMGRRGTPLRSMAAYARLVSLLAHKRYLGDLRCDDAALQRVRLFGDARETVAVLYTARPDPNAKVKLGLPGTDRRLVVRAEGIDGRRLEAAPDGTLPIPDGLTYVWLDPQKLGDRLRTDTAAMRLWQIAREEPPRRPAASPLVLRFDADSKVMESKTDGYHLAPKKPGQPSVGTVSRLPLRVRVFNLSGQPHELALEMTLSAKSARVIGPAARPVNVPAEGFVDLAWEAELGEALKATDRIEVTVAARGKPAVHPAGGVAPLVFTLIGPAP